MLREKQWTLYQSSLSFCVTRDNYDENNQVAIIGADGVSSGLPTVFPTNEVKLLLARPVLKA